MSGGQRRASKMRWQLVRILVVLAAMTAGPVVFADSAQAYAGITSWFAETSSTQAGGHPDISIHAGFDTRAVNNGGEPPGEPCNFCQDPRNVVTHFPAGFIGSPSQLPQCSLAAFALSECPQDTQVGVFMLPLTALFEGKPYEGGPDPEGLFTPIYNLPPHPEEAALLGFVAPVIKFNGQISLNARTESDYGLDASSFSIFHLIPVPGIDVYIWGVPASPIHDKARIPMPIPPFCAGIPTDQTVAVSFYRPCHPPVSSSAAEVPFLDSPTSCGVPLMAGLDLTYYDNTHLRSDAGWPATTGCDRLSFDPSLSAVPTTSQADAPAGLESKLSVPQSESPSVPSQSEIRAATVTLPPGFTINGTAADGKSACTDAEAAFGTRREARCPETSKIGTARIDTAALPGPIQGGIYLGQPKPGNRYRVFLSADGFATHVKLAGVVQADPATGQLKVVFEDLPQAPFQQFTLHFFGSERGTLATPTQCGEYPIESEFVPWDSALPNQVSTSIFTIDSGPNGTPCPNGPRPFAPNVKTGVVDNTAGAFTEFGFKLKRADGEQNLTSTTIATPPGFLASLRGIPYCPESALEKIASSTYTGLEELAASACPVASQVGTAVAGAGAGSRPLYSPGKVFLAGPYRGAPLSFALVVPAVSGPYDVGNVLVRIAIYVDAAAGRVAAVSDPFPQIIGGIPVRLRSAQVNLNRSEFVINPTNCDPFSIDTSVEGDEGARSDVQSHFQVANCASLPFSPRLGLRLLGSVHHGGHPAIRATLHGLPGNANLSQVTVKLPKGQLLDNADIGTVCTRGDFAQEACPPASDIGTAEATTPLLDQPLRGSVYLRSSSHQLPDLVVNLKGQIDIELDGRVDAVNGALRTTFETIPDAPVTSFALSLDGGSRGLLINSESLCGNARKAAVTLMAQNGAVLRRRVNLQTDCASAARRRRAAKRLHRTRRGRR